ncbi:hypothetical protein I350_07957 [Cryptococcus amylolentus CBS 6273]|uniref:Uncharacterized protein n=1 Tax=Cryptococcus amylolentus CBS 6273 TaxID=1296118 RepID=A0A1E3J7X8_9TREE|nr:hypothetical protein I350_07957 [Cryptococcus amylolentus CBS 6273]
MSWPTPTISSIFEAASHLASRLSSSSPSHARSRDKPTINLSTPETERKTNKLYMLEEATAREPWTELTPPTTNHKSAAKTLSDHAEDFLRGLPAGTTATKRAALNRLASQTSSNVSDKSRPVDTPTDKTSKRVQFASNSPPHTIHPPNAAAGDPNDPNPNSDHDHDDYAWGNMSAEAQRFLTTGHFRSER